MIHKLLKRPQAIIGLCLIAIVIVIAIAAPAFSPHDPELVNLSQKYALKMGGNVYHLYHKEASKNNEQRHLAELDKVKREHLSWCENGIDKYLS
jgi:ABC-type dipeptide/oligopeptide/nickel transport system permease subunit